MVVCCWELCRCGTCAAPGQSFGAAEEAKHSDRQARRQFTLNYSVINGRRWRLLKTTQFQVYLVNTESGGRDISLSVVKKLISKSADLEMLEVFV